MTVFVRAVVTGFGFSLGAALFRKVSEKLGLNDDKTRAERQDAKNAPGAVVNNRGEDAVEDPGRPTPALG